MASLLVYRYGGIGDTLTLTPFLASLRARFAHIALVGLTERLALIDGSLHDEIISFDLVARDLPALAGRFDESVAFAAAPLAGFARHLPVLPAGRENVYGWMHAQAEALGGSAAPWRAPHARGAGLLVHPGAGGRAKRGDLDFFLAKAPELAGGEAITFLLGPAEEKALALRITAAGFRCELPPDLAELKRVVRAHRVFLGNDSGPAHLAALNGLATHIRFTASDPVVWLPPGGIEA